MKVYVTKWALTQGIIEVELLERGKYGDMKAKFPNDNLWVEPGVWADTIDEARVMAYEMKEKKLKSLRKQIDRLEKLEF